MESGHSYVVICGPCSIRGHASLPTGPHKHIEILKASANESRVMRIRLGELGLRPIRSCAHESDNHWTSKTISILFPFVGSYVFYFN
jgi:hypothetical protein